MLSPTVSCCLCVCVFCVCSSADSWTCVSSAVVTSADRRSPTVTGWQFLARYCCAVLVFAVLGGTAAAWHWCGSLPTSIAVMLGLSCSAHAHRLSCVALRLVDSMVACSHPLSAAVCVQLGCMELLVCLAMCLVTPGKQLCL